jgi:phosphoglycolate phosphatase
MAHVFLDLDGTLCDAGPGIIASVRYALDQLDHPQFEGDGAWIVGPALWDTFRKLGVAEERLDDAVGFYRKKYVSGEMYNNRLFNGIAEQLSTLKAAGYILCLATSKPIAYASKITEHFGLTEYLTHEFGSELDGTRSDKTDLLAFALEFTGVDPAQSLMIGDRHYDVKGAHANEIRCLGASYGYGSAEELNTAGADGLIFSSEDFSGRVMQVLPLN